MTAGTAVGMTHGTSTATSDGTAAGMSDLSGTTADTYDHTPRLPIPDARHNHHLPMAIPSPHDLER